jgi:hypothetical protein
VPFGVFRAAKRRPCYTTGVNCPTFKCTIADLKTEAKRTFQEVYAMFKRFEADKFLDFCSLEDSITL